jgi:DNA primase large subunit
VIQLHPDVLRIKGGKNQQRIIDMTHELYSYGINVLQEETGKNILDHEEDFEALTSLLQTTEPLKKMYNEYQYNVALERTERIAKTLTDHMKTIRRTNTVKKRVLQEEYKKDKILELREFRKSYLARKLVELLPQKDLEKIIRIGQRKLEKERIKNEDVNSISLMK